MAQRLDNQADQLARHRERLDRQSHRLDTEKARVDEHKVKLAEQEKRLNAMTTVYAVLEHQMASMETRMADLEARVEVTPLTATDAEQVEARALVDEVRDEHRRIRARFGAMSRFEERVRRLEQALEPHRPKR
jgi:predicted  nucleic acid-binding Zn-ribbon protein